MKLYFWNITTTVTTIMLLVLIGFIAVSFINRESIEFWGRRTLFLAAFGLLICCFAAARDGLHLTIQNAIDGSCMPGVFNLVGVPTIVGCIGAAIIIICVVFTIFMKSQTTKEVIFFIMCSAILIKIITIEFARIIT